MLLGILSASVLGELAPAQTWATAGVEHENFAAADVDGDGYDDIVVRTPGGELLVAASVRGWKASGWRALDGRDWPGGVAAFEAAARATFEGALTPAPPPYEPGAELVRVFGGDLDGDGDRDSIGVYRCTRPGEFLELRVAFAPGPDARDRDGDGLSEGDEARLGTDPLDRDSDFDGLLDGWEVHGLPRGIDAGPSTRLDPLRQDVIVAVAPYEGLDRAQVERELARAAELYRAVPPGIQLHFRIDASVPPADQEGGDWARCGAKRFPLRERGFLHWMQVTPWGGGQSQQTGDMGGCGQGFAVFAHEFGHQLSLSHEGDSTPAWCPLYPSLMNYAFGYALGGDPNAIRFSTGEFRGSVLDENALIERLPYAIERLRYLATPPFRFRIESDGPSATRIDWNHDGRFDDAPVVADVNYGGSTYCGTRELVAEPGTPLALTGAGPALGFVGERCHLAALAQNQSEIRLWAFSPGDGWGVPRSLPTSATNGDPLLVGGPEFGLVLFHRPIGWLASRFDAASASEPADLAGLPPSCELSALRIGETILLVTCASDGSLAAHWIRDPATRLDVSDAAPLALKSRVPVGLGLDPSDGRLVVASSWETAAGAPLCFRVTWMRIDGERLVEEETRWVRGEASGTNCTTRPVVAFDSGGQLNLFHTGMSDPSGLMTAWRSRRVARADLDEGWLTCMLYDVWTMTRRQVAFASGPQGAFYAFRWDSGDHGDWKTNSLLVAGSGFGIDAQPMRDFDDGAKMSKHGLVHSILWMHPAGD